MATHVSKTCQVIHYLVSRLPPHNPGKTKLVKLVYLADLESRQVNGAPITDMAYRWWNHGPWDEQFDQCVGTLTESGCIQVGTYPYHGWYGSIFYPLSPIKYSLTSSEKTILDYLIRSYGRTPLKELLEDIVYATPPMKDAISRKAYGKPLRMEIVDNQGKTQHGMSLEDVLEGERLTREGAVIDITGSLPTLEEIARMTGREYEESVEA